MHLKNILLILVFFSCVSFANNTSSNSVGITNIPERLNHFDHTIFTALKDSIREELSYYKNGNMRSRRRTFYDELRQTEFKTVYEKFRKSGSKLYVVVMDFPSILTYKANYDPEGLLIVQKFYTYDREGTLIQIETRVDGISSFQTF